jgi:hypothetical protein
MYTRSASFGQLLDRPFKPSKRFETALPDLVEIE